jgi:hypothetical protein
MGNANSITYHLSGCPYKDRWYCFIHYGKCRKSPFIEQDWWFVTIPMGSGNKSEWGSPNEDHTFVVAKEYAHPHIFEQHRRNVDVWRKIAHKTYTGSWCIPYECLWVDVPVFEYVLKDDVHIKYGYCRTQPQSEVNQNRILWYVAFKDGPTFVVDNICVNSNFIDRMGNDTLKWEIICWCRLEHEVDWDGLVQGQSSGGYVRSSGFSLDSPYLPFSTKEIEVRISRYETLVEIIKQNNHNLKWNEMSQEERRRALHPQWKSLFVN